MDKLKPGDKVTVKGMYNLDLDGIGTYLGLCDEHHFKGFYRVENQHRGIMIVNPDRVKKVEE